MNCSINREQQMRFGSKVAADLLDAANQGTSFDMKDYVSGIYNTVMQQSQDHARAMDYARLTPALVEQIVVGSNDIKAALPTLGIDMNQLAALTASVANENTGIEAMESYLNIGESDVSDLRDLNGQLGLFSDPEDEPAAPEEDEITEEEEAEINETAGSLIPSIRSSIITAGQRIRDFAIDAWRAYAPTALKDQEPEAPYRDYEVMPGGEFEGQRDVPFAHSAFYYTVKRKIISALKEPGVDYDSSQMDHQGFGPMFLTAVSITQIPENQLRPNHDWANDPERKGVVLLITDAFNNPIRFDNEGNPTIDETGRYAYYMLRNTEGEVNADGSVNLRRGDRKSIQALARQKQISEGAAQTLFEREVSLINDVREHVLKDKANNKVRHAINGGSLGYLRESYEFRTPIKNIDLPGPFAPYLANTSHESNGKGMKSGTTYIDVDGMYGEPIELERPRIEEIPGMYETLMSLMLDEVLDTNGNPISVGERKGYLDNYLYKKDDRFQVIVDPTDATKYHIMLFGERINLNTPEEKELARAKLRNFLTGVFPQKEIKLEPGQSIDDVKGRSQRVVKRGQTYRVNDILEIDNGPGQAPTYRILDKTKIHVKDNLLGLDSRFDDVTITENEAGEKILTKESVLYNDFLKEHYFINRPINAEGKLIKLNAYFTFTPVQEHLDEMQGTEQMDEDSQAIEENPIEPSTITGDGIADQSEEDLLNDLRNDPDLLNKLADQKETDIKATEKQIKEAKEWYENSPLSKHVPFTVMFNAVNKNNPGSVATWAMHGITLYKGADYSDLYHEAWHAFSQMFMTKEQKANLYNETRKKSGSFTDYKGHRVSFAKATDKQLEEYLAEDFRKYMLNGGKTKKNSPERNSLFRRILNFLEALFGNSTMTDVINNERADHMIHDLYEKLRVGNLTDYTFSQENVQFGNLNKGMQAWTQDDPIQFLSYEDSKTLMDTIDSLISDVIDKLNSNLSDQEVAELNKLESQRSQGLLSAEDRVKLNERIEALKDKRTHRFTSAFGKVDKVTKTVYTAVKRRIANMAVSMRETYEGMEEGIKKQQLKKDIEVLEWAHRSFGDINTLSNNVFKDVEDVRGIIGYHRLRSKHFGKKVDVFDHDYDSETDAFVAATQGYVRGGTESSLMDLAKDDVLGLLKSLHKVVDNEYVYNKYGVKEMAPFQEVWNRLARTLEGTLDAEVMYKKLLLESQSYKPFDQLLRKLGPPSAGSTTENNLWTGFWQTFNKSRVPLIQMTLDKRQDRQGNIFYESKIGVAYNADTKVGYIWQAEFQAADHTVSPYIANDRFGNYLDLEAIINAFPERGKNRFEFLHALGYNLTDNPQIRNKIARSSDGMGADFYWSRIRELHARGVKIRNFNDLNKARDAVREQRRDAQGIGMIDGRGNPVTYEAHREMWQMNSRYKEFQKLESRFSDQTQNFMVTAADGNTQFEHSLNNYLTVFVNLVNDANSYEELISRPETAHLDIDKNPMAKASGWLKELFILDRTNVNFGQRKRRGNRPDAPFVKLNLTSLGGVLLTDEATDETNGIAAAKSDPYSKLLTDFHSGIDRGIYELMRHADKNTSPSITLSRGQVNENYIPNIEFLGDGYHARAMDMIIPHLKAEVQRIGIMRNLAATGIENFDFQYLERGQNFVQFDGILSQELKQLLITEIMSGKTVDQVFEDLDTARLEAELLNYFTAQVNDVTARLNETEFTADNSVNRTIKEYLAEQKKKGVTNPTINKEDVLPSLIRSFVYNSWIHNIESMALVYGDLAQYDVEKEGFHKRNAGAGSTGNLFRYDTAYQTYANSVLGRKYAEKLGIEPRAYDGRMNTAIIADSNVGSVYHAELSEAMGEAEAKAYADGEMNEGDAQGVISFDSYRLLKDAQGDWSNTQERLYQAIVNGLEVDPKQVSEYFPAYKAQYFGPVDSVEGTPLPLQAMHKFSLFPLIPTVIQGKNLQKLHDKMVRENIDYALFESGSKISSVNKTAEGADQIYSEGRTIDEETPFTKNIIHVAYLKDQLHINAEYKNKVIFSTQLRKLIEDGLMENGVPTDFMPGKNANKRIEAWEAIESEAEREAKSNRYALLKKYEEDIRLLTDIKKAKFLKKIGWTQDEKGRASGPIENLLKFVKNNLSERDLGDHEIDFIELGPNGALKHDLSLSLSADKIERVLNAVLVKELVKQKVNGEALVQVSGALFEDIASTVDRDYANPTEEDKAKYGTNDLPTYHKKADGTTAAMKVKIALQGHFLNLLNAEHLDGEYIGTRERLNEMIKSEEWLNKDRNRQMVTMAAVRIPVQGLNSMEFMEVYEFLPAEAGNIIVPPAEIVAKSGSDFDIDKLTVIMPNIRKGQKGKFSKLFNMTQTELKEEYENYKEAMVQKQTIQDDFEREGFNSLVGSIFGISMDELDQDIANILLEEGEMMTFEEFELSRLGSKAVENEIIWDIKNILELPENFVNLTRPNSTNIFTNKEGTGIADDLAQYVLEYDPKQGQDAVSPSRVFEIEYNLYKHASNNIGKQTLGLGAVDNTWNAVFNRVGFRMNPTAGTTTARYNEILAKSANQRTQKERDQMNSYRVQTLYMPHNTIEVGDETAISLSHDKDINGEHRIADVISQLINGWVDIAKDTWVFNIQGNKEVSPVLLFMIQAGVPVKQAVYMSSLPMVRDYVREQQLAKSTFAEPLGKDPGNPMWFRSKARQEMLSNPKYGFNLSDEATKGGAINKTITDQTNIRMPEVVGDDGFISEDEMYDVIKDYSAVTKAGQDYQYTDMERAAFLHFLEIEDMSKAVRDIKMKMSFDTTKSGTLFEAQNVVVMKEELKRDHRFPAEVVDNIIENSPIGSFFVQKFQLEVYKDLFPLRNHEMLNKFLLDKLSSKQGFSDVTSTFGDSEEFANAFRNDFVSFIFQNSINPVDLDTLDSFHGYSLSNEINDLKTELDEIPDIPENETARQAILDKIASITGAPVKELDSLKFGAFVKDGVMYVDKNQLKKEYKRRSFAGKAYTNKGLAAVSSLAFETSQDYFNFVLEREHLRSIQPYESVKDSVYFASLRNAMMADNMKLENETEEAYNERIEKAVYENYLRDTALDNTYNSFKLFRGTADQERVDVKDKLYNYAAQYALMMKAHPELKENFAILKMLSISASRSGYTNLKINNTSLDADAINVYHENLRQLANPEIQKVDDPAENKRISDFFRRFPTVAFLQSGLSTRGAFSLIRFVPQDMYLRTMEEPAKRYIQHMDKAFEQKRTPAILEEFYKKFIEQNGAQNSSVRVRHKDFSTDFTLDMSIKMLKEKKKPTAAKRIEEVAFEVEDPVKAVGESISVYSGDTMTAATVADYMERYPNHTFIYNFATDNQANAVQGDRNFFGIEGSQTVGLPTRRAYTGGIEAMYIKDFNGTIDPEVRAQIDAAIEEMKRHEANGRTLVFNKQGYGQYLIGADESLQKLDNMSIPKSDHKAIGEAEEAYAKALSQPGVKKGKRIEVERNGITYIDYYVQRGYSESRQNGKQTFLYLSKRLFEEFGYINPGYLVAKEGRMFVQSRQPITDEQVQDFMNHCY